MILRIFHRALNHFGYKLIPKGLGYFSVSDVVEKSQKLNLSLCEYLELNDVGGVGKRRDLIANNLRKLLPSKLSCVLEIGAGTGMFVEKTLEHHSPVVYEIYETNLDWVAYLKNMYSNNTDLKLHNADGDTLRDTKAETIDAAFSHGVFVYTPLITTFGYLEEMARVAKRGGWIVFDCFLSEDFGISTIKLWQKDSFEWKFPVTISESLIDEYVSEYGLIKVGRFNAPYHSSFSTYFILQKQ